MKINFPDPFFLLFRVWHGFFFLSDPQELIFRFFFPLAMAFSGPASLFSFCGPAIRLTSSSMLSIDPKKAKNRSSIKLEKMHPIDWKKIAPGRQKKQPAQNAPAVRTFPFSKFYFFCRLLFFLHCGCLHCRHAKSRNDPLSRSGLTP